MKNSRGSNPTPPTQDPEEQHPSTDLTPPGTAAAVRHCLHCALHKHRRVGHSARHRWVPLSWRVPGSPPGDGGGDVGCRKAAMLTMNCQPSRWWRASSGPDPRIHRTHYSPQQMTCWRTNRIAGTGAARGRVPLYSSGPAKLPQGWGGGAHRARSSIFKRQNSANPADRF